MLLQQAVEGTACGLGGYEPDSDSSVAELRPPLMASVLDL